MGNECSISDMHEAALDTMVMHQVNIHDEASLKCEECEFNTIARAGLKVHMKGH